MTTEDSQPPSTEVAPLEAAAPHRSLLVKILIPLLPTAAVLSLLLIFLQAPPPATEQQNSFKTATADMAILDPNENIVFTSIGCAYCEMAKKFLDNQGAAYTELDIDRSPQARERFFALGGSGTPLLVIRGKLIRGYSESQIMRALQSTPAKAT